MSGIKTISPEGGAVSQEFQNQTPVTPEQERGLDGVVILSDDGLVVRLDLYGGALSEENDAPALPAPEPTD